MVRKQAATRPATKSTRKRLIIAVDVLVAIISIGLIGWGMYRQAHTNDAPGPCAIIGQDHQLVLANDRLSQAEITVEQCDTITVINRDNLSFSLNFGIHDKHITYPGYTAQVFGPNESIKITMVEPGTFQFHDHFRDNAQATITVRPKD